jgi:adenylosuccinate lyase
MAHKRNPINFENLEGTYFKSAAEFFKVLTTMISEHQRDLVGSCISRDFPTQIVNLMSQIGTLTRANKDGIRFLARLCVSEEVCRRNFSMQGDAILAEPLYLALQMYGYQGDAHEVINHRAMPLVSKGRTLVQAVEWLTTEDPELKTAWGNIPPELHELFRHPENYVGRTQEKIERVCSAADMYLADF